MGHFYVPGSVGGKPSLSAKLIWEKILGGYGRNWLAFTDDCGRMTGKQEGTELLLVCRLLGKWQQPAYLSDWINYPFSNLEIVC